MVFESIFQRKYRISARTKYLTLTATIQLVNLDVERHQKDFNSDFSTEFVYKIGILSQNHARTIVTYSETMMVTLSLKNFCIHIKKFQGKKLLKY